MKHKAVKTLYILHFIWILLLGGVILYAQKNQLSYTNLRHDTVITIIDLKALLKGHISVMMAYSALFILMIDIKKQTYTYSKLEKSVYNIKWIVFTLISIYLVISILNVSLQTWYTNNDPDAVKIELDDNTALIVEEESGWLDVAPDLKYWIVNEDTYISTYLFKYEYERTYSSDNQDEIEIMTTDSTLQVILEYNNQNYIINFTIVDGMCQYDSYEIT